jgi:hypothetical protein
MVFIPREVEYAKVRVPQKDSVCYGVCFDRDIGPSLELSLSPWRLARWLCLWRLELLQRLRGWVGLDWNAAAIVDRLKLFFRWSRARENKIPSLFKTFKSFFLLICYCANTI